MQAFHAYPVEPVFFQLITVELILFVFEPVDYAAKCDSVSRVEPQDTWAALWEVKSAAVAND